MEDPRLPPLRQPWWLRNRFAVQVASLVLANSFFLRAFNGFCNPVLNCWSCPGANFACPIGALQNASSDAAFTIPSASSPLMGIARAIPIYVIGTLMLLGGLFGRMMCGWLCPFGWLQDQIGKLSRRRGRVPGVLYYLRYVVLIVLVFVVPYYTHVMWFSKLCPQGALEGGLLQPLLHPELRGMMGGWWWTKQAILLATFAAMLFWRRPFCAVVCPLGAIFSLFQRVSAWQVRWLEARCTHCLWCVRQCPQGIDPRYEVNSHKCVGCLECQKCPFDAIHSAPRWTPEPPDAGRAGQPETEAP